MKTICRNYLCTNRFILVIVYFFKSYMFTFSQSKTAGKYAEICRVGNLVVVLGWGGKSGNINNVVKH